ncbi:hypothetical protein A5791_19840 [Mycobacterium sp. 852002-51163_SCH5372311]|uniref:hypothetical protein n=1 Tax=Mycobacterium sp. 852002-51163_SCH5372311 TaxID=1834097 RepID=UPI0007FC4DEC|nr:hypothetical protein [Mycobacterium sp. 852002-51163_SCH5372311]OBF86950.1 hypothetical protein A5791_19840 [Mycobacterium sp. 852002-51163_SCH5372311]
MTSIATLYAEVLPETSQIADGIVRAFREVDPKAAEAGRRWGREIQSGIQDVNVDVKAETAKAKAEIDAAARDRHATIHVNVDKDRLGGEITSSLERLGESAAMSMGSALASGAAMSLSSVGTQAFTMMGQQGGQALSGAMSQGFGDAAGAIGSAAGPEGTVIGQILGNSIMSSLKPILMTGAIAALAGVASSLSGLAGLAPAGLAGAGSVVATLAIGLDGVKEAWEAAGKAADSAGKDQEAKTKAVASAQKSLRDAVLDEANAQKDVANARRDARQQLEDLNVQLRGGVIDEKQAILDAQAARRDLATGRFRDSIEYQQAQLRVEAADQRVIEAHERNVQLQGKAAEANAKGVEGSDQVVAANERLAKAHENVAAAQQGLAEAQGKTSSTAETAAQAMAKLSPAAQQFVGTLIAMKPQWESFKNSIQDALFTNLGPQIQQLATAYMPMLQGAFTTMAGLINQATSAFMGFLQQPATMQLMQTLLNNLTTSFREFLPVISTLGQAFLQLTVTGSSFLPDLGKIIGQFATAFAQFASSPALGTWLQTGLVALGQLTTMLPTVLQMFMDLAPIGTATLGGLGQVLTALAPAIAPLSNLFASFITNGLTPMLTLLAQVATTVITALAPSMTQLMQALGPVMNVVVQAFTPVLQQLGSVLAQTGQVLVAALVPAIQQLLPYIGPLVQQTLMWLTVLQPLIPSLTQLAISQLPAWIDALKFLLPLVTRMLELFNQFASENMPKVIAVVEDASTKFSVFWDSVKRGVETMWNVVKPILDLLHNAIHDLGLDKLLGGLERFHLLPSTPGAPATPPAGGGLPGAPGGLPALPGVPTAPVELPPAAAPSALPTPSATALPPSGGDTPLVAALKAKGFSPEMIQLIQGFSQVEGLNAAGQPTLGFTDAQLGGRSDLQAHVDALAQQFKDRAAVAGPFPAGGTAQQKAEWIARVVGQSGLSSDWQGHAQPQDYVQQVVAAMQGGTAVPTLPALPAPTAALPSGGTPVPGATAVMPPGGLGGVPYGLPVGTDIRQGKPGFPDWVYQLGRAFGLEPSTYAGHQERSGQNRGIDWWPAGKANMQGAGYTPEEIARLDAFAKWLATNGLAEQVIWSNPQTGQNTGFPFNTDYSGDYPGHRGHVHTRFGQSVLPPGAAGMPSLATPTAAAPYGVSPTGMPLGTQGQPMYVTPAGGPSGQQLGQDILSGFLEIFGIGSLVKNPLEGGLFKGFKGLMTVLTGGGKGGSGGGLPASAYASGGAGADIPGGDILSGLGNMLPGIVPQPYGPVGQPAAAADEYGPPVASGAPGAVPSGYSVAKPAAAQGGNVTTIDQSVHVINPQDRIGSTVSMLNAAQGQAMSSARSRMTGLPV